MSYYPLRITIIVSDADREEANQIAVEISGREADRDSYTVPLSPTGAEPATHWGCCTLANDELGSEMVARIHRIPSTKFFTSASQPGAEFLIATNVPAAAEESLMQARAYTLYDFEMMLEKVGLRRVTPKEGAL